MTHAFKKINEIDRNYKNKDGAVSVDFATGNMAEYIVLPARDGFPKRLGNGARAEVVQLNSLSHPQHTIEQKIAS